MGSEVTGSTAISGGRVGLSEHRGQLSVGPSRSRSDLAGYTSCTNTVSEHTGTTVPHYTTIVEQLCTPQTCVHCCACHLCHPRNGYGSCMRTAKRAWDDCECAGRCPPGRCGQSQCISNWVAANADSTSTVDERRRGRSRSIITLSSTQTQDSPISCHSPDESAAPLPSIIPTPKPGTRRAAGGVHAAEAACASPQADTCTSVDASYRQPSTTVSDSRLAASLVSGLDGAKKAARTEDRSDSANKGMTATVRGRAAGAAPNTPATSPSAIYRPLPTAVSSRATVVATQAAAPASDS